MNRWTAKLVWLMLLILTLGAWLGWGYLALTIAPDTIIHRVLFLGSLFLALSCTLTAPAYLVTDRLRRRWTAVHGGFAVAVRQGMLGALFVVICAVLQMTRSLTGGYVVLVLSTLIIVEVFFQVRREDSIH